MTKMSPRTMPLTFASFHLTLSGSKSKNSLSNVASLFQAAGILELTHNNIISYAKII